MNDRSQYLKIMKEWHCCSRFYAFVYLYLGAICPCICLIYLLNILFKIQNSISILIFLLAAIGTFIFWKLFKTKRKNIKQVYFTPKTIYIEDKKIDISYFKSITFIKLISSSYKGSTFKFCIKFTENPIIKEDIYFYMAFGELFEWREHYDYQNCFIAILETLAKERREILKDSGKAI